MVDWLRWGQYRGALDTLATIENAVLLPVAKTKIAAGILRLDGAKGVLDGTCVCTREVSGKSIGFALIGRYDFITESGFESGAASAR